MSITIFVTVWLIKIVNIVFLDIGNECQSICNSNTNWGRQRVYVIFSAAGTGIEDGDTDVDSDDIMMMTTKWWYGYHPR